MACRWSLATCFVICRALSAPTFTPPQSSNIAYIQQASDGQVQIRASALARERQSMSDSAIASRTSSSQIISASQQVTLVVCRDCINLSENIQGSTVTIRPSGPITGSSEVLIGQEITIPDVPQLGIPITRISHYLSVYRPISSQNLTSQQLSPSWTVDSVFRPLSKTPSHLSDILSSAIIDNFSTTGTLKAGVRASVFGTSSSLQSATRPTSSLLHVGTTRGKTDEGSAMISRLARPHTVVSGTKHPLSRETEQSIVAVQSRAASLQDDGELSLSKSSGQAHSTTSGTGLVAPTITIETFVPRNSTLTYTTPSEAFPTKTLLPIPVESPIPGAASIALHQITSFRSLSIVSQVGPTRLSPLNTSQQTPSITFSPRFGGGLNSSAPGSSDTQTFLATLRTIETILPSAISQARGLSDTSSSSSSSPLPGAGLNPYSSRSSFSSPSSILPSPKSGIWLMSGAVVSQTLSHTFSLSLPAALISGGADPSASFYLSAAQSSTLLPTTTEKSLPSEASLETLFSGSYTSNQWITTKRPGSSTETVVPIIVPPGQHDPVVLWNVLPGPPPGGIFPIPPRLEIDAPELPCIRIFGLSIGSCPTKEKGKPDPDPKAISNPQVSPKSRLYPSAGPKSTHPPSQTETRSSDGPSATCTSSIATLTSVSCAIAGSSSSCTETYTTRYGCDVTGSLVSTALCAAQTTISSKTLCCSSTTVSKGSTVCMVPSFTVGDILVPGTVPQTSIGSLELLDQLRSYRSIHSRSISASSTMESLRLISLSSRATASAASQAANSTKVSPSDLSLTVSQQLTTLTLAASTTPNSSFDPGHSVTSGSSNGPTSSGNPGLQPSITQEGSRTVSNFISLRPSHSTLNSFGERVSMSGTSLSATNQASWSSLGADTSLSGSYSHSPSLSADLLHGTMPASSAQPLSNQVNVTNVPGENGLDPCILRVPGDPSDPGFCPGTDYCQCGSVGVPPSYATVVTTLTGVPTRTVAPNCNNISIQPTANLCPENTASIASASAASASAASASVSQTALVRPTASSQCFPSHEINDLLWSEPNIDSFCSNLTFTVSAGTVWDDDAPADLSVTNNTAIDPQSPLANNNIRAGFTATDDAPSECPEVFQGEMSDIVFTACSIPLKQIVADCPYNGGSIDNACGQWWLMTCPLGEDCPKGCPGGNYAVGDPNCGTPWRS